MYGMNSGLLNTEKGIATTLKGSKVFGGALIKLVLGHRPGQFSTVAGQFNPQ